MIDTSNNFPHIIRHYDPSEEFSDKYFIAVEQAILLECRNLVGALFHLVAVHYVFNIQYNMKAENMLHFLEERILGLKKRQNLRNPKYLSFLSAIDCLLK